MSLLDALVPPAAVEWGPSPDDRVAAVLYTHTDLAPLPAPVVFGGPNYDVLDVDPETLTDEELDEVLVIHPDAADYPELFGMLEHARRPAKRIPNPWHPLRWSLVRRLVGRFYVLGIISGSGHSHDAHGWFVFHVSWRGRRPYLLGRPRWWWACHRRQGLRLRGRHRPLEPFVAGTCAACIPCLSCGAPYACEPGCEALA